MTQPSINHALKSNKLKYDTGSATKLQPLGKQGSAMTGVSASAQLISQLCEQVRIQSLTQTPCSLNLLLTMRRVSW